ncbi:MAG: hypothetical protein Q9197_002210 [Variospora fuerteventurae]
MRGALAGVSVPILLTTSPATGASQDGVLGQMVPNARDSREGPNNSTRQSLDHKIITDLGISQSPIGKPGQLQCTGDCRILHTDRMAVDRSCPFGWTIMSTDPADGGKRPLKVCLGQLSLVGVQMDDARRRTEQAPVQILKRNGRNECKGVPLFRQWEEEGVWLEGRATECNAPADVLYAIAYREVYWQSNSLQ